MASYKNLCLGILAGVALTVISLDIWGRRLEMTYFDNAQPRLIRPLTGRTALAKETDTLPHLWFPQASGKLHENWRVTALDGRSAKLGDFRGHVVLLNFWSTTCAPCLEEMPAIERLHNSLQGEPVKFLLVTQEDIREVRTFASKKSLAPMIFVGAADLPSDLAFHGFPTTLILDRGGAIVFKYTGIGKWDDDEAREYIRRLVGNTSQSH